MGGCNTFRFCFLWAIVCRSLRYPKKLSVNKVWFHSFLGPIFVGTFHTSSAINFWNRLSFSTVRRLPVDVRRIKWLPTSVLPTKCDTTIPKPIKLNPFAFQWLLCRVGYVLAKRCCGSSRYCLMVSKTTLWFASQQGKWSYTLNFRVQT